MARPFNPTLPILVALAVAGCGGGQPQSAAPSATVPPDPTATATATPTPPAATAPSAPSPPPDAPTPTPSGGGESQPGGGGDEAAARVPVAVTVASDGSVSPRRVAVPAFLALELQVRNRTAGAVTVSWTASEPAGAFGVGAGKTGTRQVAGVRPGSYELRVEGAGSATVVSGSQPGP
jgi:hypothetical protein